MCICGIKRKGLSFMNPKEIGLRRSRSFAAIPIPGERNVSRVTRTEDGFTTGPRSLLSYHITGDPMDSDDDDEDYSEPVSTCLSFFGETPTDDDDFDCGNKNFIRDFDAIFDFSHFDDVVARDLDSCFDGLV
jgi:hypothetical protein